MNRDEETWAKKVKRRLARFSPVVPEHFLKCLRELKSVELFWG